MKLLMVVKFQSRQVMSEVLNAQALYKAQRKNKRLQMDLLLGVACSS